MIPNAANATTMRHPFSSFRNLGASRSLLGVVSEFDRLLAHLYATAQNRLEDYWLSQDKIVQFKDIVFTEGFEIAV